MKKIFLLVASSLFMLYSLSAQLLCGTYDDFDAKVNRVGAFHNAYMDNLKTNFMPAPSLTTKAQAIDYIRDFTKNYFQQHEQDYFPVPLPPVHINNIFESSKSFVDNTQFNLGLFTRGSGWSLDDCVEQLRGKNILDVGNLQIFQGFVELVKDAKEGTASDQLEISMVGLANNWLTINEGKTGNGMEITGSIIAIGLKSREWWTRNLDAVSLLKPGEEERGEMYSGPSDGCDYNASSYFVFPWLTDAVGALISGGFNLINQAVNGEINWNAAARATVGGAAFSSGGVVSKVTKWIKSLF